MEPNILQHLNSVLRVQLTAVQQHFIHVLTLKAWGDEETAKGITALDAIDLPNALRIVDFIVSIGAVPELCRDYGCLTEHMPAPGCSYEGIFAAECRMEEKLTRNLRSAQHGLSNAGTHEVASLISGPLVPRESYGQWLRQQSRIGPGSAGSSNRLSDRATSSLDAFFAHLMVVIEQGIVHSFVHWHVGKKKLADFAWSMSGAAMMQATEITNCLALRRCAPSPADAVVTRLVPLPRIGRTSEQALKFDRAIAERCREVAERANVELAGTEFETVCRRSAAYFDALSTWRPRRDHPVTVNPCRGFERVLKEYVWENDVTDRVLA